MPYVLPVVTILVVGLLLFTNPNITGFLIAEDVTYNKLNVIVTLHTYINQLIPENATVLVKFANQTGRMAVKEFISRSGGPFNYINSENKAIKYKGYGFIGDYNYSLDLKYFNIDTTLLSGEYTLNVEVLYNYFILSEYSLNITLD